MIGLLSENLKCKGQFEMTAAISNLSTRRILTCFANTYTSSFSYCLLCINIDGIQYYPSLYVGNFSIHVPTKFLKLHIKDTYHNAYSFNTGQKEFFSADTRRTVLLTRNRSTRFSFQLSDYLIQTQIGPL